MTAIKNEAITVKVQLRFLLAEALLVGSKVGN